jgi:CrcB protein
MIGYQAEEKWQDRRSCYGAVLPKRRRRQHMLLNCAAVGAGGALGAIGRYLMGLIPGLRVGDFPLPTLVINFIGAVVIGLVCRAAQTPEGMKEPVLLFLKVGLCGGFTTFSTFSLESLTLLEEGKLGFFVSYVILSVALCILGVFLGLHR